MDTLVSRSTKLKEGHLHNKRLSSSAITSSIDAFNARSVSTGRSSNVGSSVGLQFQLLDDFLLRSKETERQETELRGEELSRMKVRRAS